MFRMFKKDILNGHWRFVFASAFVLLLLNPTVCSAETQAARCIDLHLAEMQPSVAEKGRMQDMPDTKAARRVLKRGKRAIPALISCLTDESRTKHSVFPFWPETTVGDIAFVFLTDLFTDSTWQPHTLKGMPGWDTVMSESPSGSASFQAWDIFVAKHGRKYLQDWWSKTWREKEAAIYWDESERCFKEKP
jgi:hypothetical protein